MHLRWLRDVPNTYVSGSQRDRACRRCAAHLSGSGVYRECLLAEMEQILLEEHPEMKAGDGVFAALRDRPAQEE